MKYKKVCILWCLLFYLYRFFDLCRLTHIPLVDSSNALFRPSSDSWGDGRGGVTDSWGDGGGGVTNPWRDGREGVEVLLRVPPPLDDPGSRRFGVDCIGGSRMRNGNEDDSGVMVVEDGRDADLATFSGGETWMVGRSFAPCRGGGASGPVVVAEGILVFD